MKNFIYLIMIFIISSNLALAQRSGFFSEKDIKANSFFKRENKEVKSVFDKKNAKHYNDNKVIAISAIFNSHKEKETLKNLEDFYEFCVARKIIPKDIYLNIIPMSTNFNKVFSRFALMGVGVKFSIPEELKGLKFSPAYIVYTPKGYYYLDGFKSISQIITKSGIFLEPR